MDISSAGGHFELNVLDFNHRAHLFTLYSAGSKDSCVEGMGIKAKSSHNPQATELQKKEEPKPNPSGLKSEGYVPGAILVKLYNGFAILYSADSPLKKKGISIQ